MHRLSLIPTEHRRIHRPFYRATTKNAPASMCTPARDRLTQNWLALVRVACTAVVAPTWRAGASPRAAIISVTQRSICPSRTTQRSKSCCNGNETISNHYMPLCKFEYFCRGYGKKLSSLNRDTVSLRNTVTSGSCIFQCYGRTARDLQHLFSFIHSQYNPTCTVVSLQTDLLATNIQSYSCNA